MSVFVGGNVYNCLIAYNTATSGDCGGLCEQGWTYKNMYNNTVVHNVAKKAPAGIKVAEGTFRNCIVWGNTLSDDGSVSDANTVGGKGLKAPWMKTAKDLVGRRRIIGGKVDIGCYETDFTYGLMLIVR